MELKLSISDEVADRLTKEARSSGVELATYAAKVLQGTAARLQFAEIARPVAEAFRESGMTEDELEELLDEAKREVRAEKRLRRGA